MSVLDLFTKLDEKWEVPTGCTCLYIGGPTGVLRANSPECSLHMDETVCGSLTPDEIVALIYCEAKERRSIVN
mgnify:CR=1